MYVSSRNAKTSPPGRTHFFFLRTFFPQHVPNPAPCAGLVGHMRLLTLRVPRVGLWQELQSSVNPQRPHAVRAQGCRPGIPRAAAAPATMLQRLAALRRKECHSSCKERRAGANAKGEESGHKRISLFTTIGLRDEVRGSPCGPSIRRLFRISQLGERQQCTGDRVGSQHGRATNNIVCSSTIQGYQCQLRIRRTGLGRAQRPQTHGSNFVWALRGLGGCRGVQMFALRG